MPATRNRHLQEESQPWCKLSKQAFSLQMSDHFPLLIQLDTAIDGHRLNQIVQAARK